jgi:hypothetical protein
MKKTIILIFLLILMATFAFAKPTIKIISYHSNDVPDFVYQMVLDKIQSPIISSKRFNVIQQNRLIYDEKKLQLIFSSKNTLLSSSTNLDYVIYVFLHDYSEKEYKTFEKTFIRDDKNGDYMLNGSNYVQVYKGVYYKYDSETDSYVRSDKGNYVKGYDGKYYIPLGFYDKLQQNVTYKLVTLKVDYKLQNVLSQKVLINKRLDLKSKIFKSKIISIHPYKEESNPDFLVYENLIKPIDVYSYIKKDFLINAKILKVLDDRNFVLGQGLDNTGVVKGQYYKISKDKDLLGVLKVISSFKDTSQAKLIYLKSPKVKIEPEMDVKEFDFQDLIPIHIGIGLSNESTKVAYFALNYSQYDLYRRPLNFFEIQSFFNTKYPYDFDIGYSWHLFSFLKIDSYAGLKFALSLSSDNLIIKDSYLNFSFYPNIFSNANFWKFYNRLRFTIDYSLKTKEISYCLYYMVF